MELQPLDAAGSRAEELGQLINELINRKMIFHYFLTINQFVNKRKKIDNENKHWGEAELKAPEVYKLIFSIFSRITVSKRSRINFHTHNYLPFKE